MLLFHQYPEYELGDSIETAIIEKKRTSFFENEQKEIAYSDYQPFS